MASIMSELPIFDRNLTALRKQRDEADLLLKKQHSWILTHSSDPRADKWRLAMQQQREKIGRMTELETTWINLLWAQVESLDPENRAKAEAVIWKFVEAPF